MFLKSDSFMTKDISEFSHFRAAACRECVLRRDEEASQPKGLIQGIPKLGPYWKFQLVKLNL